MKHKERIKEIAIDELRKALDTLFNAIIHLPYDTNREIIDELMSIHDQLFSIYLSLK